MLQQQIPDKQDTHRIALDVLRLLRDKYEGQVGCREVLLALVACQVHIIQHSTMPHEIAQALIVTGLEGGLS